ncbi:MAG: leucine-rich repeat protein, partial [Bacilli bacterium]
MANKKDVLNKMMKMDMPEHNKDISSKLTAGIFDLIAINIGFFLICLFTLGLGWPIAVVIKEKWKCQRTYISGKKLKFVGTGGELFVEYIKWILLTIITLGIFLIWFPNKKYQWTIRHTHFEDTDEKDYNSNFSGGVFDLFITNLVSFIMIAFTLGIAAPWAITFKKRWVESHSFIDGNQLSFSGSGIGLIGSFIKWIFFSLITLGIYSFWFVLNLSKWMAKNRVISTTSIASVPVFKTIGFALAQHKKATVATCIVLGLCLAGAGGIAIYIQRKNGTYRITWKNYDGTVLEVDENVPFGDIPTYDGEAPTQTETQQYKYTFHQWFPKVNKVFGNKTYTATFSSELQTYTVVWKNYDGTVLEVDENVPYGTTPTYDADEPVKMDSGSHYFAFSGWGIDIEPITHDETYYANFDLDEVKNPNEYLTYNEYTDHIVIRGLIHTKATYVVLPNLINNKPVTVIDDYAFYNCYSLEYITIPDYVTYIGDSAFESCQSIEEIIIPDGVTSIGSRAFYRCEYLESIILPDSIISIGSSAFEYCSHFKSISIPQSLTSISTSTFENCRNLETIVIPNSVTHIGDSAFENCDSIASISIPDSVIYIGISAFAYCSSLQFIILSDNLYYLGSNAFKGCNKLTSEANEYALYIHSKTNPNFVLYKAWNISISQCTIQPNTKFIYDYAFSSCTNLTSLAIPNSVVSIGASAFSSCTSLTSVTIPNSV